MLCFLWKTDLGMRDTFAAAICTLSTLQLRPVIRQLHQMTLSFVSWACSMQHPETLQRPLSLPLICFDCRISCLDPYIRIISCDPVISTWRIRYRRQPSVPENALYHCGSPPIY